MEDLSWIEELEGALEPLDQINNLLDEVTEGFNEGNELVKSFGEILNNSTDATGLEKVSHHINQGVEAANLFGEAFGFSSELEEINKMAKGFENLASDVQPFVDGLTDIGSKVESVSEFSKGFKDIKKEISGSVKVYKRFGSMKVSKLKNGIGEFSKGIRNSTKFLGKFSLAKKASALWTGIMTTATWAWSAATNAGLLPITAIVLGIAALVALITAVVVKYDEWGAALSIVLGPLGMIINLIQSFRRNWDGIMDAFTNGGFIAGIKMIGATIFDAVLMPVQQLLELASNIPGIGSWAKGAAGDIENYRKELGVNTEPVAEKEKDEEKTPENEGVLGSVLQSVVNDPDPSKTNQNNGEMEYVPSTSKGSGFAPAEKKTVNVSIGKLIENFSIQTNNIKESSNELKALITRAIMDGVRDAEVAI